MRITTLLATFLLSFSYISSQNIELYVENELVQSGHELFIEGVQDDVTISIDGIEVKNNSHETMDLVVKRNIIDATDGSSNSFCWGICFPDSASISSEKISLRSKKICDGFTGNYNPNGNTGSAKIKYIFFDQHNPDDSVSIIINYKAALSTNISDTKDILYSGAYPNPANTTTSFDYEFNSVMDAQLIIYNLLGATIAEINIIDKAGRIKVDTTEFDEGIYFYSLLINKEVVNTQKLIVNH